MARPVTETVRLHRAQQDFRRSAAPYRGFVGGRGAGKTWVGAYDLLRRALPGATYLVVSPTYTLLDDITLPAFTALATRLGVWRGVKLTPRPNVRIACKKGRPPATVRFRSAEDPEKLRGPNLSGCWLDEASLMDEAAYSVVIACLREGGRQGWLSATFTPKGRSHWTHSVFGKRTVDTDLFHARTRDNPFNAPDFEERLRRQYAGLLADQELSGLFVNVEGAEWPPEYFEDAPGSPLWFDTWPEGLVSRTLALDPSKGKDARKGDYAALVELACDRQGLLWCEADLVRGRSAEWVADWTVDRAARFRPDVVGVESNQFLQLFAVLIAQSAARRGRTLPLVEIHNHAPKLVRIRRLGPYLCQRRMRFRDTPGTRLLVEQLREFPEGEHDDGPDAAEMSLRLMEGLWIGAHDETEEETVYRA